MIQSSPDIKDWLIFPLEEQRKRRSTASYSRHVHCHITKKGGSRGKDNKF